MSPRSISFTKEIGPSPTTHSPGTSKGSTLRTKMMMRLKPLAGRLKQAFAGIEAQKDLDMIAKKILDSDGNAVCEALEGLCSTGLVAEPDSLNATLYYGEPEPNIDSAENFAAALGFFQSASQSFQPMDVYY